MKGINQITLCPKKSQQIQNFVLETNFSFVHAHVSSHDIIMGYPGYSCVEVVILVTFYITTYVSIQCVTTT